MRGKKRIQAKMFFKKAKQNTVEIGQQYPTHRALMSIAA